MIELVRNAGLAVLTLQPLSMWPADRLPRNADGSLSLGRLTIAQVEDTEYQDFLTYQYLVVAGRPDVDRLASARRALDEHDFEAAYERARDAAGADEFDQKQIMAKALSRLGKLDAAEKLYREALAARPKDQSIGGELGIVLVAMNRVDEAQQLLTQAVSVDAENDRFVGALGLTLLAQGKLEEAFAHLKRALEINFDNEALLSHLTQCARTLDRLAEVDDHLRRFVDYYPGNVSMAFQYAAALRELGRQAEARDRLETVLLLAPEHAEARQMLDSLGRDKG
jgi:tetratricopeptide (TPR) repeat protein